MVCPSLTLRVVIEPLTAANPLNQQSLLGERGRKRAGITQIHWDFESGVLRNVGKDGAIRPSAIHLFHAKTHTDVLRTLLRAYVPGSATSWATPSATASPVAAALRDLRGLRYWLRLA